jgi:hypothetical protein
LRLAFHPCQSHPAAACVLHEYQSWDHPDLSALQGERSVIVFEIEAAIFGISGSGFGPTDIIEQIGDGSIGNLRNDTPNKP